MPNLLLFTAAAVMLSDDASRTMKEITKYC